MFRAMKIRVLKLSKLRKPKAKSIALDDFDEIVGDFELGISLALEYGIFRALITLSLSLIKVRKTV